MRSNIRELCSREIILEDQHIHISTPHILDLALYKTDDPCNKQSHLFEKFDAMKIVIIGKNFTISTDIILNNSIHISYPPIYIV